MSLIPALNTFSDIDYYSLMEPEDREYYHSSPPKERCTWCQGITKHSIDCERMRYHWHLMRWGKYKKHHVSQVPTNYLSVILKGQYGTQEDRQMFFDELCKRDQSFNTEDWRKLVEIPQFMEDTLDE